MEPLERQVVDCRSERKCVMVVSNSFPSPIHNDLPDMREMVTHHIAVARWSNRVNPEKCRYWQRRDSQQPARFESVAEGSGGLRDDPSRPDAFFKQRDERKQNDK